MDPFVVCLQANWIGKRFFTLGAIKGLSCMNLLMYLKAIIMGENLVTLGAANFLLSCMDPFLCLQEKRLWKWLFTQGAIKDLSCMNLFVGLQAIHLGESHVTLWADKGLLSCMDSLVCLQITRIGERLATIGAGNNFSCMEPLVYL